MDIKGGFEKKAPPCEFDVDNEGVWVPQANTVRLNRNKKIEDTRDEAVCNHASFILNCYI